MARLSAFEGIPAPYDKQKRMVVPQALKVRTTLCVQACTTSIDGCCSSSVNALREAAIALRQRSQCCAHAVRLMCCVLPSAEQQRSVLHIYTATV
jgi:hypothetical protein